MCHYSNGKIRTTIIQHPQLRSASYTYASNGYFHFRTKESQHCINVQLELLNLTSDKLIHICLTIRLHTPNNLELS